MKTSIIIPARYGSTRYPGKPLTRLNLKDGSTKSLIQLSWEAAAKTKCADNLYIATDCVEIKREAEKFGANVIMTSSSCENGTARCAEALKNANIKDEIIINFQGDAPLTPSSFVNSLIQTMKFDASILVATPILRCNLKNYLRIFNDRKNNQVGATTVVFDKNNFALYFSKEIIPYINPSEIKTNFATPVYHHVGVYAYKKEILSQYSSWEASEYEYSEGLEQLRFLWNGVKIKCVMMTDDESVFWELNNPSDKKIIEEILGTRDEGQDNQT